MKIVSLAPSNTEILFALGAGKFISGVTRYCDYPDDAKYIKKVGGWLDIKMDVLKKIKPDVVFTSNFLQDEIATKLSKEGINVIHLDPRSLTDVYNSIITIGEAIDKTERAQGLVDEMKRRLEKIRISRNEKRKVRIYAEEWHMPTTVSGNWVPELIEYAGGLSYCSRGKKSFEVYVDEIAKFNPNVAIISWCGFGRRMDMKKIMQRPLWNRLPAFKNGNVYSVDDSLLNRPGPRLVEGCDKIAKILDKLK